MLEPTPGPGPGTSPDFRATGRTKPLVERAKDIIMKPKAEWPVIDAEPSSIQSIYMGYVAILAAIGPICMLIGQQVFGVSLWVATWHPPLSYSISMAVMTYVGSLISVYVLALIIDALAPNFGGTKNQLNAFKVSAYSMTAAWVVGIFGIIPALAILGILGLYSLYLLYTGLPILMRVPQDKALVYTIVAIVAAIVLWFVVGVIVGAVANAVGGPSLTGGLGAIR